jgi:hypothetical protein
MTFRLYFIPLFWLRYLQYTGDSTRAASKTYTSTYEYNESFEYLTIALRHTAKQNNLMCSNLIQLPLLIYLHSNRDRQHLSNT